MKVTLFNPNTVPYSGPVRFTLPGIWPRLVAKVGGETHTTSTVLFLRRLSLMQVDNITLGALEKATFDLVPDDSTSATIDKTGADVARPTLDVMMPDRVEATPTGTTRDARQQHYRGRHNGLVVELWIDTWSDRMAEWELLIVACDPSNPTLIDYPLAPIVLFPEDRWTAYCTTQTVGPTVLTRGLPLIGPASLGDSQAVAWRGVLVKDAPPWLSTFIAPVATTDVWLSGIGPLPQLVPPSIHAQPSLLAEVEGSTLRYLLDRADQGLGLSPNGNSTGDQRDFGCYGGLGAVLHPGYLLPMLHSAMAEAHRQGNWRDANGLVVDPALHPNWVTWNAYTHYSSSVSSDRLGKAPGLTPPNYGWGGPDREHWSLNNLAAAVQFTASPMLERLVERHAMLLLSGETLDSRLSTSHAGAPRGIGRTLQAFSSVASCLLRDETAMLGMLQRRERDRLSQIILPEVMRNTNSAYGTCLGLIDDPRAMGAGVNAVAVWQESLGILGLFCQWPSWIADPSSPRRRILEAIIPGWITHGWRYVGDRWSMADYVEFANPSHWVRREGFEEWSLAALDLVSQLPLSLPEDVRDRARLIAVSFAAPTTTIRKAQWRIGRLS